MYNILFIDDEKKILNGIRRELYGSKLDWTFHYRDKATDAITLLEEDSDIDLVVTDIKMPDMDGLALITHLQNHFPGLKTIVLSGHCHQKDQKNIEEMGIPFFSKPFPLNDLMNTISLSLGMEQNL
ncbi:hypothetical protein MTBPR1_50112 [Candidatus Terasakiella magnetica]|uniref:Response regulatory domain-containing protein n=1 Tax=Candidatus Terasakiella magnetica TaxID=1867952 RepID=A0A1C3RJA8_9PROT|nr:response regulator [Candidatus Terasakiella magnetica]SCA57356.1 hypothetical protein MTBPR1_50112 [Candidatus Terasakiella magnetica]